MQMTRLIRFALLTGFAAALFAADISGTWTAPIPPRPRAALDPRPAPAASQAAAAPAPVATFVLKAEGKKLTGTAEMPAGGRAGSTPSKMEIREGQVEGDTITFTIGDGDRENHMKGKVSAGKIDFEMTSIFDDFGTPPVKLTATRAK